ncbi:uncharacterized protein B0I36DRAFT_368761 [Microdochium trichocladiopsis]|uniref:Major facilitator superfamily (MFS) profile domain-containing protein n=1 Tax=Microdochium trichocladiopsis TaxID=1682393 RepID=A0A9P9BM77_9PEZI|nr:uncharacterized protein B0I36DRAFT_368761 [Microdochium trichocladiopsis]KAH7016150.1 hypothetical protein B0I36DRAFT_368761 [Microdochium trichocladiopsis]
MASPPPTAADIQKLGEGEGPDSGSQTATEPQQGDDTDALEGASEAAGDIEKAAGRQEAAGDRRVQVICIALYTLLASLTATMFAPGVDDLVKDFKVTDETVASLAVSIYVLGFAIGPLLFAPLSERYGRLPVYASSGASSSPS